MIKFSLVAFVLALSFATQVVAAPRCVDIYSLVKKVKEEKSHDAPVVKLISIWGKEFQSLQSMSREYKNQLDKKVRFEDRKLTNNAIIKETLDWMIRRLESPEVLAKYQGHEALVADVAQLVKDMKSLRGISKLSYIEFLRVSHDFSYRIEGRKEVNLSSYFLDVTTAKSLDKFLHLPSQIELSVAHINEMFAERIMPLGLIDKPIKADGIEYSPSRFFMHDLAHAFNTAIREFIFEKVSGDYWKFKAKLQTLSENDQHVFENLWFLLTHETFIFLQSEKEVGRVLGVILDPKDPSELNNLYHLHTTHSDLQKMSKEDLVTYLRRMENLLNP